MAENIKPVERVCNALRGQNENQRRIAEAGIALIDTLLRKNHDYGSSAWDSPILAPHLSPGDAILCRMSDKVKRIESLMSGNGAQVEESIEDTIKDLAGYAKRIESLMSGNGAQVEESIEDTIKDLAGYALLWLSRPVV